MRHNMTSELVLLENMERNGEWLSNNYNEVSKTHLNEFVAIKDTSIVAHNERLESLLEEVRARFSDLNDVLIEYIFERGFKAIL